MLLDGDDSGHSQYEDYDRDWAVDDEDELRHNVKHVLSPGMLFGEGLMFQGEVVQPAVGRLNSASDEGLPLRRGGSEAPKALRGQPGVHHHPGSEKKVYEVIRQLGSGSYAVVYLVREKSGRRREYGEYRLPVMMNCADHSAEMLEQGKS